MQRCDVRFVCDVELPRRETEPARMLWRFDIVILMRLAVIVVCASCAGSGAWVPAISPEPIADPHAHSVAFEFPDNSNGTEILLTLLGAAKAAEVTAISALEIQVGPCAREVSAYPLVSARPASDPELDPIVVRAHETKLTCRKLVDQILVPGEAGGFSDAKLEVRDSCEHTPIDHVVTRYRFEVDHGFVPPDWREIKRWTSNTLTFGAPRCGNVSKNEIRGLFHTGAQPSRPSLSTPRTRATRSRAIEIIELAKRAETASNTHRPSDATSFAEQALALFSDGHDLDDRTALDLAEWIAAAHFYAVEADVDNLLRRKPPVAINAAWATNVGVEIDRIAKRYERIQDRVRLPIVAPWLRAGAKRLARLHRHVAGILDGHGQERAAQAQREKASALDGAAPD